MLAEVSAMGTIPAAEVSKVVALLSERFGSGGAEQRQVVRTYQSALPADKRGLGELRVVTDARTAAHELRTEATERLAIKRMVRERPTPCLEARRVGRVEVSNGVHHFVESLGFAPAHEALRRGYTFRQGAATISVFELCRRLTPLSDAAAAAAASVGGDDEWEALGEGALWLVEIRVCGDSEQLAHTVTAADSWVDNLASISELEFQPVVSLAEAAAAEAQAAALAAIAAKKEAAQKALNK